MELTWTQFILAICATFAIGGVIGLITMSLLAIAGRSDREMEIMHHYEEKIQYCEDVMEQQESLINSLRDSWNAKDRELRRLMDILSEHEPDFLLEMEAGDDS